MSGRKAKRESKFDLTCEVIRKLADRNPARTEATVQSLLHALLLAAPLQLEEGQLTDIVLEQPTGQRHRIDVEAGCCVFEVKRNLRKGNVLADAEAQLAGYVRQRSDEMGQRYVGVLTDGCDWRLYRLHAGSLVSVSTLEVDPAQPDVEGLCVWLEGVLSIGEQLTPTPHEIERLLGARSPAHLLDVAELVELYEANKELPEIRLKRQLWAKLLTTALGTAFSDDDLLFVQHTLLVVTAEVIAHAVLELDPQQIPPLALVSGQSFRSAKVLGVVEADFFDWPATVPGGENFIRGLARRLARFAWADVDHDVLKVLYESVIPTQQRKQLGEYYTPDWLAEYTVQHTISNPLSSRIVDPSCGSGTFIFYAVRQFFDAADEAGMSNNEAIAEVCNHVMGMDLHPVAVTLARVTYLLAIGSARLTSNRGQISIPVFLGDSLQWGEEEALQLQTEGALVVYTDDGPQLFPSELRFPDSLVADAGRFDSFVAELAELATRRKRGAAHPSLSQVHRRYGITQEDQPTIERTFRVMCSLHDEGRDHIWGYYVRNLARPRWLAREANQVDVLIGNPPWLSYRYMTATMQQDFGELLKERKMWPGAKSVTHVDLSALFVARCIERYLKKGGRFAFVMPYAVLSRQHFAGFRRGHWPRSNGDPICAAFETSWDFHAVKPPFFEVPCCVIRGRRMDVGRAITMPRSVVAWEGVLPRKNLVWGEASQYLKSQTKTVREATTTNPASPYGERFTQGASLVPRMICFVEEIPVGPLGSAAGEVRVRSRRSATEKLPWKTLPSLEGSIEAGFVFPVHVGDTIVPFRPLSPLRGIIPWDGKHLLHGGDELISRYPGLNEWWGQAEATWVKHRSSERLSLREQVDFRGKLSSQFRQGGVCPEIRVVYSKSGMYLAAAVINDPTAVIDHKLYWAACGSREEADYLCAILNSTAVTLEVRSFQARGEHNPRDFDMYVWQLPIPEFDSRNPLHRTLANLGKRAAVLVAGLELPKTRFEKQRRFVREQLAATDIGTDIEVSVKALLRQGDQDRRKKMTTSRI